MPVYPSGRRDLPCKQAAHAHRRFDSDSRHHSPLSSPCRRGEIHGRHTAFRAQRAQAHAGSTPAVGTIPFFFSRRRHGEIGRRAGFRSRRPQGCAGSSPAVGTTIPSAPSLLCRRGETTVDAPGLNPDGPCGRAGSTPAAGTIPYATKNKSPRRGSPSSCLPTT